MTFEEDMRKDIYIMKSVVFVKHMEEHIRCDEHINHKKGSEITEDKVGCTICGKDIDQIFHDLITVTI